VWDLYCEGFSLVRDVYRSVYTLALNRGRRRVDPRDALQVR